MKKPPRDEKLFICQLLVCDCEGSMKIDGKQLAAGLGLPEAPRVHHQLCRAQLDAFESALEASDGQKLVVACTQEAPLFSELAGERGDFDLSFANIRENAGWSKDAGRAGAKMAALIAEAAFEAEPAGLLPVISHGSCIVYGSGQSALDAAVKLSDRLNVTLLLADAGDILYPRQTEFPVFHGRIRSVSGSMGDFTLIADEYGAASPSSREKLTFDSLQYGAQLDCDLIFDLSGGAPLVGGAHGRDGYVRAEPDNPAQTARALFGISGLSGEFEKPVYTAYDKSTCAHGRSGLVGCSNCIDNCPASAITPDGDYVKVDSHICDGCGHCSSSCPSGAIAYDFPNRADLLRRCQILASTFLKAGGAHPVLLLHEERHGGDLISAMARFGDGLAANVLPLAVQSVAHPGHDAFLAFFTCGVQTVVVLAPEKSRGQLAALEFQIGLANSFLQAMGFDEAVRVQLLYGDDPDAVSAALAAIKPADMPHAPFTPVTNKREMARLALGRLNEAAPETLDILPLADRAPYGRIVIDVDACTLCLSCVGACPAGALGDNENRPLVSLIEQSCVQCGLCRTTCPENAITLEARYNFDKGALSPVVLNEEEPLECTRCGKPFGSKSAIEKVIGILEGKNPMFQTSAQSALLKMCDNCRVIAMAESEKDPMTIGIVPRTLTAADVLPEDDDEPVKH